MYCTVLYCTSVRLRETVPYFDTLEAALTELVAYANTSLSSTDDMKIEPGVYPGSDASGAGTYIQWNMDNSMWEQFITDVLVATPTVTGGSSEGGVVTGPHGNIPLSILDPAWFTCLYNSTDRQTPAAVSIKSLLDVYFMKTHWRMMLIGEQGAGMFNHKDTLRAPTWQVHLHGRKLWHLCPPTQDGILEKAGKHDFFDPNYEASPELLTSLKGCSQAVVGAGDLVYYPEDYWHQTMNLDTPAVSIGSTMLTAASYGILYEELERECNSDAGDKPRSSTTTATNTDTDTATATSSASGNVETQCVESGDSFSVCSSEEDTTTTTTAAADAKPDVPVEENRKESFRVFPPHAMLCGALPACLRDWEQVFSTYSHP
jgi:hypothetical protein